MRPLPKSFQLFHNVNCPSGCRLPLLHPPVPITLHLCLPPPGPLPLPSPPPLPLFPPLHLSPSTQTPSRTCTPPTFLHLPSASPGPTSSSLLYCASVTCIWIAICKQLEVWRTCKKNKKNNHKKKETHSTSFSLTFRIISQRKLQCYWITYQGQLHLSSIKLWDKNAINNI